jgi:hypothetical protein
MGTKMRSISLLKIAMLAGVVALSAALPSSSFAARMKLPPGACAAHRKILTSGMICSFNCNPASNWCSQQMCINGTLQQIVGCYGAFCSAKCG